MSTSKKDCWVDDTILPPVTSNYETKGSWIQIGELNTYTTGSSSPMRGIILIYDAFGVSSQTLQGADRLASHLSQLATVILVPDFFKGQQLDATEHAVDPYAPHKKAIREKFMKKHGDIPNGVRTLLDYLPTAKNLFPDVENWGVFGLCWGGKVAVLASISQASCPFKVSGQTHPAGLNADDARKMTVPHICLASPQEPAEAVKEYGDILKEKDLGLVETYATMFHGWMGARANLEDEENKKEYERGYKQTAEFFAKFL